MSLFQVLFKMLANIAYHIIGRCTVCGRITLFICTDAGTARNNMHCIFCRSSSRKRHVAKTALWKLTNNNLHSFAEVPAKANSLNIYNTDSGDAFGKVLRKYPLYICSDFFPNVKEGTQISERIFCQNLENLTFPDETFDLVITEDILEHVRNWRNAVNEIHRILKHGGFHIFTIPFLFDSQTVTLIDTSGAEDRQVMPPEFHGDRLRGIIPVYRKFGFDLFESLKSTGFETVTHFSRCTDTRHGIVDSFVFISRKI